LEHPETVAKVRRVKRVACALAIIVGLVGAPATAHGEPVHAARSCGDIVIRGFHGYRLSTKNVPCAEARRLMLRWTRTLRQPKGYDCSHDVWVCWEEGRSVTRARYNIAALRPRDWHLSEAEG
jgi:hypothetical protein